MEGRSGDRQVTRALLQAALVAAGVLQFFACDVVAADGNELPYIGNWSNGRGETLVVTASTLRFGKDRAVPYRDVTRATDGDDFELQIIGKGEVNAFPAKTLAVHCDGEEMHITGYASHEAYMQGGEAVFEVTWYRDSDDENDDTDEDGAEEHAQLR